MAYVDGFVFPVSEKNVAAYTKMAKEAKTVWKKFGALDYKECQGDDLSPNGGHAKTSFPKLAKLKEGETVWFSYIVFKSRSHRDAVNKKVMAHFEKKYTKDTPMPFDMKRMAYGGFKVIVG
jgi:uncharacterized protein YbaA (DUF1428 family)